MPATPAVSRFGGCWHNGNLRPSYPGRRGGDRRIGRNRTAAQIARRCGGYRGAARRGRLRPAPIKAPPRAKPAGSGDEPHRSTLAVAPTIGPYRRQGGPMQTVPHELRSATLPLPDQRRVPLFGTPATSDIGGHVRKYFETSGFSRWTAIYGSGDIPPIWKVIRDGHQRASTPSCRSSKTTPTRRRSTPAAEREI